MNTEQYNLLNNILFECDISLNSTIASNCTELEHLLLTTSMNETKPFRVIILLISLIIIIVGVPTNAVSMLAFFYPKNLSPNNIYLASLCASNTLALVGLLINSVLYNKFTLFEYMIGLRTIMSIYPYVYPIITTSQIASIYLTVCVSINQFITIAFPRYHASNINKSLYRHLKHRENKKAFNIVIMIILMSILFCLPYWFAFKFTEEDGLQETNISLNPIFKRVVHFYMYLPIACVIPFLTLIVTNVYLVYKIEKTKMKKSKLKISTQIDSSSRKRTTILSKKRAHIRRQESKSNRRKNKTLMLITVVFFFLICQSPTLFLNLSVSLNLEYEYFVYLVEFSKLLLIINLSFNFAIFYLFSKRFRKTLKDIICQNQTTNIVTI